MSVVSLFSKKMKSLFLTTQRNYFKPVLHRARYSRRENSKIMLRMDQLLGIADHFPFSGFLHPLTPAAQRAAAAQASVPPLSGHSDCDQPVPAGLARWRWHGRTAHHTSSFYITPAELREALDSLDEKLDEVQKLNTDCANLHTMQSGDFYAKVQKVVENADTVEKGAELLKTTVKEAPDNTAQIGVGLQDASVDCTGFSDCFKKAQDAWKALITAVES
ncbi:unnamed protein product [Amoebophrya sp. A120]|nr:unnamed protein product [Amoebophrya sp. A120]|eukprot:GSA120T00024018001.1